MQLCVRDAAIWAVRLQWCLKLCLSQASDALGMLRASVSPCYCVSDSCDVWGHREGDTCCDGPCCGAAPEALHTGTIWGSAWNAVGFAVVQPFKNRTGMVN